MRRLAILLACLAVLNACGPRPTETGGAARRLALTLYSKTLDDRYTYFELSPTGQFSFAGGRDAVTRGSRPVVKLSPAQIESLWAIIEQERLLDAPSSPFKKPQRVEYEITIRGAAGNHSFRALDDQVPGAKRLHDALFDLQAGVRYK